jgi:phosphate transport system substrate-binding protein
VAVDAGQGCIAPTVPTIADGTYTPLSRLLYVYVNLEDLAQPEVQEFLRFSLTQAATIVSSVGYVPLPLSDYAKNEQRLDQLLGG